MLRLLLNNVVFLWKKYLKAKSRIMAKIKVTQVKSGIKKPQNQKRTLEALGLKRIGQVVEHDNTPNILGMINKVKHLVSTEEA